jgi:bacterioferritin (cytochrome b1)
MFRWLSETSGNHAKYLSRIAEILGEKISLESIKPRAPESSQLPSNLKPAEIVYHGAKTHLELEKTMMKVYGELAEQVENPEIKEIFQRLSKDEEKHHEELSKLVKAFEKAKLGRN